MFNVYKLKTEKYEEMRFISSLLLKNITKSIGFKIHDH